MMRISFIALLLLFASNLCANERLAPNLDKQKSPKGKGATVLYSLHKSELGEGSMWQRTKYYSIKIHDLEATRDYGRISIYYDSYYHNISLDLANVLTKDGQTKKLDQNAINHTQAGHSQDFYDTKMKMTFSLPHIEPGSIIEFQYTLSGKNKAIKTLVFDRTNPYWYQQRVDQNGYRADKVKKFSYTQITPKHIELESITLGGKKNSPRIKKGEMITKSWRWKNIKSLKLEPSMKHEESNIPMIISSNTKNWGVISSWFSKKVNAHLTQSNKVNAVIKKLNIKDNATKEDIIKAVYAFMQNNIRYVYAHVSRGGYEPHSPDETISSRFGDCKDQAVLAIALLKVLNIEAYPLLVETPSKRHSDTTLVTQIFDHVIVYIPDAIDGKALYMDTTGDRLLFPGTSNMLNGMTSLITRDNENNLHTINIDGKNGGNLDLTYKVVNNKLVISTKISYQGSYEQSVRNHWKHDHNRENSLRQLFNYFIEDTGQYTLDFTTNNSDNLFKGLTIDGQYTFNQKYKKNENITLGVGVNQFISFFGLASELTRPSERSNPFWQPHAIETKLSARFITPLNYQQALVISQENIVTPFFTIKQSLEKDNDDLLINMVFNQQALDLNNKAYKTYRDELLKLKQQGSWLITQQIDILQSQNTELELLKKEYGEKSTAFLLQQGKNKIDQGKFEDALTLIQQLVNNNNNHGEAWYLLAVTHGYLGQLEESTNAFNKAKQLGYTP